MHSPVSVFLLVNFVAAFSLAFLYRSYFGGWMVELSIQIDGILFCNTLYWFGFSEIWIWVLAYRKLFSINRNLPPYICNRDPELPRRRIDFDNSKFDRIVWKSKVQLKITRWKPLQKAVGTPDFLTYTFFSVLVRLVIIPNAWCSAKKAYFFGCWICMLVGCAHILDVVWVVSSVTQSIGRVREAMMALREAMEESERAICEETASMSNWWIVIRDSLTVSVQKLVSFFEDDVRKLGLSDG